MRWRDRNALPTSQAEALIALRARRQAHQIAREVLNPHIPTAQLADAKLPTSKVELEYRARKAVDHRVAAYTSSPHISDSTRQALVALALSRRVTAYSIADDEHAARRHAPLNVRYAPLTIFILLFIAIVICVGLMVRELLRVG